MAYKRIVVGVDVAKRTLACCILIQTELETSKVYLEMSNTIEGFNKLHNRLRKLSSSCERIRIVMEPTSIYHCACRQALYDYGYEVCQIDTNQSYHFRQFLGTILKNDKVDSYALAQFGLFRDNLRAWQPTSSKYSEIQNLMKRRQIVDSIICQEQNRLDGHDEKMLSSLADQLVLKSIEYHKAELKIIDKLIKEAIDQDSKLQSDVRRLQTIPGIGEINARQLVLLFNTRDFKNSRELVSFLGLCPREKTSGTSVRGTSSISKHGPSDIRKNLFMGVRSACFTSKHNSPQKNYYLHLKNAGKATNSALCAVARKQACVAFSIWKDESAEFDASYEPRLRQCMHIPA